MGQHGGNDRRQAVHQLRVMLLDQIGSGWAAGGNHIALRSLGGQTDELIADKGCAPGGFLHLVKAKLLQRCNHLHRMIRAEGDEEGRR